MTAQIPIPDFVAARAAMVESQLRPQGVTNARVLSAMGAIPREQFLPDHSRSLAYMDRAVTLGHGRFLSAPAVLGQLLTQMMPEPGTRALVVGTGAGYSAAVLKAIGLEVVAIETVPELVATARGHGVDVIEAPLEAGFARSAPYDQILIDGAIEVLPETIVDQLAEGGRLGAALVDRGITRLIVGRKSGGAFGYLTIGDAGVPVLPSFSRPKAFTF